MPVTLNLIWVFCIFEVSKKLLEQAGSLKHKHWGKQIGVRGKVLIW